MSTRIRLHGVPFSQPVRAVAWLMLYKGEPFELVPTNPGSTGPGGSRHADFLTLNPGGTIPTLEEPDTGFSLGEANAILCYLANSRRWDDVYPTDPRQRARIDWYLHYHHRNLREASVGLVAPNVRKDLSIPDGVQQGALRNLTRALEALDSGWLDRSRFLAGDEVTLADFAAYAELGQLQPQYTNLFDFSPFPNIQRWLEDMQLVDGHDVVHVALAELGDISREAPTMERLVGANKSAVKALVAALADLG